MTDNGLTDKQQNTLLKILCSNPKVEAIWLFGSRAIGNYRANSDIDIALAGDQLTTDDIASITD